jgi:DNA-binding NtrC family response regulator
MNKTLKALVLDDDDLARRSISSMFRVEGWEVYESRLNADPLQLASAGDWNVVICELAPERNYGFDALGTLAKQLPKAKVVLTASRPNAADALDAIKLGAFEYLPKPLSARDLQLLSKRLNQRFKSRADAVLPNAATDCEDRLIGNSRSFIEVMKQVGRVAGTSLPVLLTGESGTGKEVIAATLHEQSDRCDRPFVALNCGAIPATLIESELFGHEKGSFTGADRDRQGLWEQAAGGTLFLDEITETSPSFQVKLLRIIERGEVRRVGSNQVKQLDVRIIAASNRDVEQEVEAGRFRQDLFYRLNAVSIQLPPLRERKDDIPLLLDAFVRRVSGKTKLRFSSEALEIFDNYPWPGNVRELEHAIMRCVAMCDGVVLPQDLPERIRNHRKSIPEVVAGDVISRCNESWVPLADVEGQYVARVLSHTNWNKQAAARTLNVDRKTLDRMIKRHNIVQPANISKPAQNRQAA